MTTERRDGRDAEILRVVNAAGSPTDLAGVLAGSGDAVDGLRAARTLLEHRDSDGAFRNLEDVRRVVNRSDPDRFDQVAGALADLVIHVGSSFVGLVDPDSTFAALDRVAGGVISKSGIVRDTAGAIGWAGPVEYDDFAVELGLPGADGFLDWVSATLKDERVRRSGEVHVTDGSYRPLLFRGFVSAAITEVIFPECNASSTGAAALKVRFRPETIRQRRPLSKEPLVVSEQRSIWQARNFAVEIDGLPTAMVSRVGSFSWTGGSSGPSEASAVISLTMSMSDIQAWWNWMQDIIVHGGGDEALTKAGRVRYLSPELTDELGRIEMEDLMLISLEVENADTNVEDVARFTVRLSYRQLRWHTT